MDREYKRCYITLCKYPLGSALFILKSGLIDEILVAADDRVTVFLIGGLPRHSPFEKVKIKIH